jgi:hypothetical protein
MTGMGERKQRERDGGGAEQQPHGKAGGKRRGRDLAFVHPNFLKIAAMNAAGRSLERPCGQMVAPL